MVTHLSTKLIHRISYDSDHSTLSVGYHAKALLAPRRQFYTRPKHKLTSHALNQHLENNDVINSALNYTDPNLIAEIIMSEFNNIIEIIAPCKSKQEQKNYTPYINKIMRYKQRKLRKLYDKAKRSKQRRRLA